TTPMTDKARKPLSTITNASVTATTSAASVQKVKPAVTTTHEKVDLNKTMPLNNTKAATENASVHTTTKSTSVINKDSMKR
ncbi:hypothetical protein, partial [Citrobacter braakii]|uniref:hypothetical protein n=1 Tax=Citrobacter braakii TaxID=57706 RepID=UPI0015627141